MRIPLADFFTHSRYKHELILEVMCDWEIGGVNSANINDIIGEVKNLPENPDSKDGQAIASKYRLTEITSDELFKIEDELDYRKSRICFHPESNHCDKNDRGHFNMPLESVWADAFLNEIAEDDYVMVVDVNDSEYTGEEMGLQVYSKYWGFCNEHSSIYAPIEKDPYQNTPEQNFLFAYRAFITERRKHYSESIYKGTHLPDNYELVETEKKFKSALLKKDYNCLKTEILEIPGYYPLFGSLSFQVTYDFEGRKIYQRRGGWCFITLLAQFDKCLCLISYFNKDQHLSEITRQIRKRNDYKRDISILVTPFFKQIYYNPSFFESAIEPQQLNFEHAYFSASFDVNLLFEETYTPKEHMQNPYGVDIFGYEYLDMELHLN